mgnify:CR=1 FL=1
MELSLHATVRQGTSDGLIVQCTREGDIFNLPACWKPILSTSQLVSKLILMIMARLIIPIAFLKRGEGNECDTSRYAM